MRHRIVTRFAVPRQVPGTIDRYKDPAWLDERLRLLRAIYVPSVARLGVPAVLLCARAVAPTVAERVADLDWLTVVEQDDWTGGLQGEADETLTRLDSDDAIHPDWLEAVERTLDGSQGSARVCLTRRFVRYDLDARRLHRYRRDEPAPLAAFSGGANPYAVDHKHLDRLDGVVSIDALSDDLNIATGPYLLSVVHGGNVKNRRPKWWRLDRRVALDRLAEFGLDPDGLDPEVLDRGRDS
ncbi:MAG: hypothetical protein AAGC60_21030 [Acidobacteriota bacterium]